MATPEVLQFPAEIGSCWKPGILQQLLGVKGFRRVTSLVDLYSKQRRVCLQARAEPKKGTHTGNA